MPEADESQLWIALLQEDCGITGSPVENLYRETNELIAILVTMASKARRGLK